MDLVPFSKTDLGRVAVAVIEKLSAAVGVFGKPLGTWLQAVADAEAAKVKAVGEVKGEFAALRARAVERLAYEELRNQQNLESVYGRSIKMFEPGIDPANAEKLDNDWLVAHSEGAKLVLDEELQDLWAPILGGWRLSKMVSRRPRRSLAWKPASSSRKNRSFSPRP